MSFAKIHNFIVHQIVRDSSKGALLKERKSENKIDELTSEVFDTLLTLFNKTGLQTGSFDQNGGKPKFEQTLLNYCSINNSKFSYSNFKQMTVDLARILEGEMNTGAGKIAKPVYIVFFHHSVNTNNYLSVITLLETKGFALQDLSFRSIDRLDLDKLHLAARIRLDDWNSGMEERYISFRVGRTSEMRDYFKEFIGCKEFSQAKIETSTLVDALKMCCRNIFPDNPQKTVDTLELADKFCRENKDQDGRISLESLGKHLFPDHDGYLLEVCQGEMFLLSEKVNIDNNSLKGLIRYRGQDKKMSISFDADLLQSQKVEYDKSSGKLTFHVIPESLKAALNKG